MPTNEEYEILSIIYEITNEKDYATYREIFEKSRNLTKEELTKIVDKLYDLGMIDGAWKPIEHEGKPAMLRTITLSPEWVSLVENYIGRRNKKIWLCNICGAEREMGEILDHLTDAHSKELIAEHGETIHRVDDEVKE